ncbi:unnamed protein product [Mytilus coruscus]|uniref:Reverse transcriptase domain-containing protein n=1 Tax=Mytilus coruscus TaxID=42192 RepID=A0A6J8BHJ0_MYTCO|nr:unnamed protein product [Mytilus coruscus]
MRKIIGPTSVPGKQADIPKRSSSSETVKYQFYNLHEQDYEYENSHNGKTLFFVGSLYENFSFWKEVLKATNFVFNVISDGNLISFFFFENPSSARLNKNMSAFKHSAFVEHAINKLLQTGAAAIECKDHIPFAINPLTVSVNAPGKERLILDLRHVNQFTEKIKCKFEIESESLQYTIKDGYIVKFDLTCGYHHVSIHKDHQTHLGFSLKFQNTT